MLAMTRVSEWSTRLPGAYWYVTAPSWTLIGLYYGVLIAGLIAWTHATQRAWAVTATLAGLVALLAIGLWDWAASRSTVTLTFLPLSGGQVVYTTGGGTTNRWLINCGNATAVEGTLKPFLRAHGVNRVPRFLLTTGDTASSGGAEELNQLFGVGELYTSATHFRTAAYGEFVTGFDQSHGPHQILRLKDQVGCWQVLHPGPADHFARAEDNALVLRGQFFHSHVLLLADLGREGQSALLGRQPDLSADIVVASVPSQGEPVCDDLLQAAQPKVVVIVDAEYPVPHRASYQLKKRLAGRGIPVIYTRTAGAATLVARPDGWEMRTMDGQIFKSANLPAQPAQR